MSGDALRTGILEKIAEGWAVILLDPGERELALEAEAIPAGINPGDAVVIEMDGDRVIGIRRDADRTARRSQRIRGKMDRLRQLRGRTAK